MLDPVVERSMLPKRLHILPPELILVSLYSAFQAGAVCNDPGPNFGRKPAPDRPKRNYRFYVPLHVLVNLRAVVELCTLVRAAQFWPGTGPKPTKTKVYSLQEVTQ
jgi:hypothetical protein